ncbi:MAG: VanZ family protein [Sandaracinaceae bacterium]|nr:VanZ family protein [Sandaracinaceae bacterium]
MSTRVVQVFLAFYATFLVGVVIAANIGGTNELFGPIVRAVPYGDKVGHFALIGLLAMLVDLAARRRDFSIGRLSIPMAPLVLFGLVLAEELSQLALDTRTCDPLDVAADIAGMVVFVSLGRLVAAKFLPCDSGARRPARRS